MPFCALRCDANAFSIIGYHTNYCAYLIKHCCVIIEIHGNIAVNLVGGEIGGVVRFFNDRFSNIGFGLAAA